MVGWKITYDHLEDKYVDIDMGINPDIPTYQFRLYDDDGTLYYSGISNDNDSEEAFAPLDWGMVDSGCIEIRYLENGKWETL